MCQICISVHFGSQNKGHTFYTTSKIIGECAPILAHACYNSNYRC